MSSEKNAPTKSKKQTGVKLFKNFTSPLFKLASMLLSQLEYIGTFIPGFTYLYTNLFYRKMIAREIKAAGVEPGDKVLHVGCGSLPATPIALVRAGCRVIALERNEKSLERARKVAAWRLNKKELSMQLEFRHGNGLDVDSSGYDAVWISLHVTPQLKVLKQVFASLDSESRVVYRKPTAWLSQFYPLVIPEAIGEDLGSHYLTSWLGKESVVIWRQDTTVESSTDTRPGGEEISLADCRIGEAGVITQIPDCQLLAPLGLRPGKYVRLRARQSCGGPLVVQTAGRKVAVDRDLADAIKLRRKSNG